MPAPAPFTPPDFDHARTIATWLRTYTARPHPHLGRSGPVCPFITPALRADGLRLYAYRLPEHLAQDQEAAAADLAGMLDQARTAFHREPWPTTNRAHRSLLILLPDLQPGQWPLVDRVHAAAKDRFVADGLMLGQFHPTCPAPAAHNPAFAVNRAPIPLLAIRHMQPHDILFLHHRPEWLEVYATRFAHLHHAPGQLSDLYHQARARHAPASRTGAP